MNEKRMSEFYDEKKSMKDLIKMIHIALDEPLKRKTMKTLQMPLKYTLFLADY